MSYLPTVVQAIEPKSEVDLYLPQAHMRKWNLQPSTLTVQFGNKTVRARVSRMERNSRIWIRPSLAQALHLPTGVPLLVDYQANQQSLVLGPYMGILVSAYHLQYPLAPFGPLSHFFNEVADSCRKRGGVICAFRPQDVNWEAGIVRGLVRKGGSWSQRVMPLPQCIYNRLVSRQRERSEAMSAWIQRCKEANIPFFNERFLNKWHVHTALEKQEAAVPHLPGMLRYENQDDLQEMITRYHTVYAKPANGSMGRGIIRIRRRQNGYQAASPGGLNKHFSSISGLHKYLSKRTKGKPYLLQQGLPLIGVQSRPADFRVLVQKDRKGEWSVTSLVARLGQNRIVSNVSRGGSMVSPAHALRLCGPWACSQRPTPQTLKHVALKLSRLLEEALPGHYAEFGVDLGVDVRGQVWLLEVNSKPSKTANSIPIPEGAEAPPRRARPSAVRMFEYASYISGFPRPSPNRKTARKKTRRR